MKKILNLRLPVILAFTVAAGVALGYLFVFYSVDVRFIIAAIAFFAAIFIVCAVFVKRKTILVTIVLVGLLFTAGALNCFFRLDGYSDSPLIDGQTYEITACVYEKGENKRGEYVMLKNLRADGQKINGKMRAYLYETYGDFCDVGYDVKFTAEIGRNDPFPYGKLNFFAEENVKYDCTVYNSLTSERKFSPLASIRAAIRETLYSNLDKNTASVAFALLTGNTHAVDEGSMQNFRYGGIAHVFAVSGLHIGVVFLLIDFLTKKLRVNRYAAAAVCILFIFFYAAVCGFTVSSVRAAIMCAVSASGKLLHKKYDALNSLSVSAAVILAVTPLSLFAFGFQLSVGAVGGIIMLSNSLKSRFTVFPEKISSAAGASLAAQAGTLPVVLGRFGYLSAAGLLLNILVVPLISAVFVLLFVCTIFSSVFGFAAAYVMPVAALPLKLIISVLMSESFEGALLSGFGAGAFIPLYYICVFALSDKFNLKTAHRLTAVFCAMTALVSYVCVKAFPPRGVYKISVSANYGGGSVLIKHGKENILIVTQGLSPSGLQTMLSENYSADINTLIILGDENCATEFQTYGLNCDTVVVYKNYIPVQPFKDTTVLYESEFTAGGTHFAFTDGYSLTAKCGNITVGICAGETVNVGQCDLIVAQESNADCRAEYKAFYNDRSTLYGIYDCGNLVFTTDGEKLKLLTLVPYRPTID